MIPAIGDNADSTEIVINGTASVTYTSGERHLVSRELPLCEQGDARSSQDSNVNGSSDVVVGRSCDLLSSIVAIWFT
jgi:hypothetical protein